jgi:hypothetical protein
MMILDSKWTDAKLGEEQRVSCCLWRAVVFDATLATEQSLTADPLVSIDRRLVSFDQVKSMDDIRALPNQCNAGLSCYQIGCILNQSGAKLVGYTSLPSRCVHISPCVGADFP